MGLPEKDASFTMNTQLGGQDNFKKKSNPTPQRSYSYEQKAKIYQNKLNQ